MDVGVDCRHVLARGLRLQDETSFADAVPAGDNGKTTDGLVFDGGTESL